MDIEALECMLAGKDGALLRFGLGKGWLDLRQPGARGHPSGSLRGA